MTYRWRLKTLLVAFGVLAAYSQAATPRDELLRLLPDDVGFCLVIQNLRHTSESFRASPFVAKFRASPLGQAMAQAPEMQKLAKVHAQLQAYLQVDWPRLRDDILGDAVIFAYRPGAPGQHDQDQGIFLLWARDPKFLAELVDRLNTLQKAGGDLRQLQTRKHHGREYYCRIERKQTHFYYLHGPVLAFTGQEAMLQRVIDLERQPAAKTTPFILQHLRRLGVDGDAAALWVNPRAFDNAIENKAAQTKPADAVILKKILSLWKPLEGIAFSAVLHKTKVEWKLAIRAKAAELPAPLRSIFSAQAGPSELWNRFPPNAILVLAGKADLRALGDLAGSFLPPGAHANLRQAINRSAGAALGKDVFQEVLPCLGPDWGFCLAASPREEKGWFPQVIAALRVRPGDTQPPVDQALLNALNSFAMVAVVAHNHTHAEPMSLKTAVLDKVEVKYLAGSAEFPPGLEPAFALKDGYLLLASNPEAVRRFAPAAAPRRKWQSSAEIPWMRLAVGELRAFLKDRLEPLARELAHKDRISQDEAARRLHDFIATSRLIDRIELTQRSDGGRLTITFRVHAALPLRK